MFSCSLYQKSSSFPIVHCHEFFWNTEARGTTSSTLYALMSRESWLKPPSQHCFPSATQNRSKHLLTGAEQHKPAPELFTQHNTVCFLFQEGWTSVSSLSKLICSHSTGYHYSLFSLWSRLFFRLRWIMRFDHQLGWRLFSSSDKKRQSSDFWKQRI